MERSRFKSITAYVTLAPVVLLLGDTYGLWEIIHMPKDVFTKVMSSIGSFLVAVGIFNNPSITKKTEKHKINLLKNKKD